MKNDDWCVKKPNWLVIKPCQTTHCHTDAASGNDRYRRRQTTLCCSLIRRKMDKLVYFTWCWRTKSFKPGRAPRWPVADILHILPFLVQRSPQDFGWLRSRWSTELLALIVNRLLMWRFIPPPCTDTWNRRVLSGAEPRRRWKSKTRTMMKTPCHWAGVGSEADGTSCVLSGWSRYRPEPENRRGLDVERATEAHCNAGTKPEALSGRRTAFRYRASSLRHWQQQEFWFIYQSVRNVAAHISASEKYYAGSR